MLDPVPDPREHDGGGFAEAGWDVDEPRGAPHRIRPRQPVSRQLVRVVQVAVRVRWRLATCQAALVKVWPVTGGYLEKPVERKPTAQFTGLLRCCRRWFKHSSSNAAPSARTGFSSAAVVLLLNRPGNASINAVQLSIERALVASFQESGLGRLKTSRLELGGADSNRIYFRA